MGSHYVMHCSGPVGALVMIRHEHAPWEPGMCPSHITHVQLCTVVLYVHISGVKYCMQGAGVSVLVGM